MDTRDAFAWAMKSVVGPTLRQAGFVGSGSTWRLRGETGAVGLVNVQKSAYGSRDVVVAVFNLAVAVAPTPDLTRAQPWRPSLDNAVLHARLALSGPGESERWWRASSPDDVDQVVRAMLDRLSAVGLPELRELLDDEARAAFLAAPDTVDRHLRWVVHTWNL